MNLSELVNAHATATLRDYSERQTRIRNGSAFRALRMRTVGAAYVETFYVDRAMTADANARDARADADDLFADWCERHPGPRVRRDGSVLDPL